MDVVLNPIEEIQLQSGQYGENLNERLTHIDQNFQKLVTNSFLKGDPGDSIEVETVVLGGENNPLFYRSCDDTESIDFLAEIKSAIQSLGQDCGGWDDGLRGLNIQVLYVIEKSAEGDKNILKSIFPFTYLDPRFIDLKDAIGSSYKDKIDHSCSISMIVGDNGVEFKAYQNSPTIFWNDDEKKFCWKINGNQTDIICQGPAGKDGNPSSTYVAYIEDPTQSELDGLSKILCILGWKIDEFDNYTYGQILPHEFEQYGIMLDTNLCIVCFPARIREDVVEGGASGDQYGNVQGSGDGLLVASLSDESGSTRYERLVVDGQSQCYISTIIKVEDSQYPEVYHYYVHSGSEDLNILQMTVHTDLRSMLQGIGDPNVQDSLPAFFIPSHLDDKSGHVMWAEGKLLTLNYAEDTQDLKTIHRDGTELSINYSQTRIQKDLGVGGNVTIANNTKIGGDLTMNGADSEIKWKKSFIYEDRNSDTPTDDEYYHNTLYVESEDASIIADRNANVLGENVNVQGKNIKIESSSEDYKDTVEISFPHIEIAGNHPGSEIKIVPNPEVTYDRQWEESTAAFRYNSFDRNSDGDHNTYDTHDYDGSKGGSIEGYLRFPCKLDPNSSLYKLDNTNQYRMVEFDWDLNGNNLHDLIKQFVKFRWDDESWVDAGGDYFNIFDHQWIDTSNYNTEITISPTRLHILQLGKDNQIGSTPIISLPEYYLTADKKTILDWVTKTYPEVACDGDCGGFVIELGFEISYLAGAHMEFEGTYERPDETATAYPTQIIVEESDPEPPRLGYFTTVFQWTKSTSINPIQLDLGRGKIQFSWGYIDDDKYKYDNGIIIDKFANEISFNVNNYTTKISNFGTHYKHNDLSGPSQEVWVPMDGVICRGSVSMNSTGISGQSYRPDPWWGKHFQGLLTEVVTSGDKKAVLIRLQNSTGIAGGLWRVRLNPISNSGENLTVRKSGSFSGMQTYTCNYPPEPNSTIQFFVTNSSSTKPCDFEFEIYVLPPSQS